MNRLLDYVLVNGVLMRPETAQISLRHPIFRSSYGVYESIKVDAGHAFHLHDHLDRLHQSARFLDFAIPVSVAALATWLEVLLAVDRRATFTLRILVLPDPTDKQDPLVAFLPEKLQTYADALYRRGASAILYQGQRAVPRSKSLNTLVNFLARRQADRQQVLEALLFHGGQLLEGSRSNLFAVEGKALITPPEDRVLSGITRDIVIRVMANSEFPVVERNVADNDLSMFSETFITSTSMHVMPITRIDGETVGSGGVGPVTRQVMGRFENYYRRFQRQASGE
jgi:D-alanine transaminase